MSLQLAGSARVAIAAVSIGLGAVACGSADGPAAERSVPTAVVDTPSPSNAPSATDAPTPTVGEATSTPSVSEETSERTTTSITTASADSTLPSTSATVAPEPGVSEAEVTELERQLDEIDQVLADLEAQLSED